MKVTLLVLSTLAAMALGSWVVILQNERDLLSTQEGQHNRDVTALQWENLQLYTELHAANFCISHLPKWGGGFGGPWTIEKYWRQEQLWVALKDYHTREAAEDVKAQLQSGQLKTRDLFR